MAGLELNTDDDIVHTVDGRPRWLRPVWPDNHGAIPFYHVSHIHLLDILEVNLTRPVPDGFQTENHHFDLSSLRVVGQYAFTTALLHVLTYTETAEVLGNLARSVGVAEALFLDYSLALIRVEPPFDFYTKRTGTYEKEQLRMKFCHERVSYDFPVTDPAFLATYRRNPDCLHTVSDAYLCISLGGEHNGAHYKLVAGVVY